MSETIVQMERDYKTKEDEIKRLEDVITRQT
jgi:hypothetical protein